ncbi:MAG: hypothetical protein KGL39_17585 [Patescibacteria group bacterium]|nr:hypothetical protein [Patescibacteria group bacterium]
MAGTPYSKTTWASGDVISAPKLNNLETQYDDAVSMSVQKSGDAMTGLLTAEAGVKVTTSGAAHSFTWEYNSSTGSLDLIYN